jgi:hypothetical protein
MTRLNLFLLAILLLQTSLYSASSRPSEVEVVETVPTASVLGSPATSTDDVSEVLLEEDVELELTRKEKTLVQKLEDFRLSSQLFLSEVPSEYADFISLSSPENRLVTLTPKVVIKGKNEFLSPTYINSTPVRLRGDGQFYYEIEVPNYGKQTIYITFTTPDSRYFTLERKVLRLFPPPDIDNYSLNRREFVFFFNTPYIYNPDRVRKLSDPFTRADLAYFIGQLKGVGKQLEAQSQFEDVPEELWVSPYVSYVVKERVMSEYPDGLFRPSNQVNKSEYLMTMVRTLNLPLDQSVTNLPFKDVDLTHWSAKFIRTALKEGLVAPDSQLQPEKPMTLAEFIQLAQRIKEVQVSLESLASFDEGFHFEENEESLMFYQPILLSLQELNEKLETLKKVEVTAPELRSVVFDETVTFSGIIFPPAPITIGDTVVTPNVVGEFHYTLPVEAGKNVVDVTTESGTQRYEIHRLTSYTDLEGHWLEATAAQLKFLNITDKDETFRPKESVSRADFLIWVSRAMQWSIPSTFFATPPEDVDESDPYYPIIMLALEQNIMSLDAEGQFRPDETLNKAEALTAIVRLLQDVQLQSQYDEPFPFWDVPKRHWARGTVAKGLEYGLISPSHHFYPKKDLNRAELAAILAKLPAVQLQLEALSAPND